ncbi:small ubiquitin-related modifier 1-like [Paramacrobiotus metropolitanus]|uniref:small ubiquitin-related modifier 1-like n=1 Tax=Paramacrobiotus metropolitanus TaxID=2943436 RepID=UPI002445663D|nr:small ubiquitin-related modifier 1-like [Paramacrobiotus metropolitanus]XP_055350180.1 small ubiquitin-related modifier 1-like [Paramacrobiotus metropolitanus]
MSAANGNSSLISNNSSSDEFIQLKAVDQENNSVTLKVKKVVLFRRIIDGYARKKGLEPANIRFTVDGTRVRDDDTPTKLGLEDGDIIDVYTYQQGGGS